MDGEQLEILKELIASVVPLGVLTVVVLAVILFGICTATESAAIGALGALYLAVMARVPEARCGGGACSASSSASPSAGTRARTSPRSSWLPRSAARFTGRSMPGLWHLATSPELRANLKQSTFLTAKTTAMVCWLFVGSALFSAVFALHGGQSLIERWVLSMNLSPLGFQICRTGHHLPARLAARMDRDHRDLLPDLHPAAEATSTSTRSSSARWSP